MPNTSQRVERSRSWARFEASENVGYVTRSYEKDGVKRTVTEIIASDVEFLTARDSQGDSSYNQREYSAPARKMAPMPEEDSFTELSDEDLPF